MANQASNKVLILGGGLIGLSVAHELAKSGMQIEILSRRRSEAAGFVAAGMLAPHAEGLQEEMLNLGQLSLKQIPAWVDSIEKNSGINCGLKISGIIVPFIHDEEKDSYPTAKFGEHLNRKELIKEIPDIAEQWTSGLLFQQDGQIDNRRSLMRALEKSCVELGVEFQEGVEVMELLHKDQNLGGVKIKNTQGIIENIFSEKAILCSGAWSKQLMESLPIFPVKGQMLSLQAPKNTLKRVIFGPGTYLVPREDGLIIVGATSEPEACFRTGLTPFGQRQIENGINSILPTACGWPPMERWWGFRPSTPDEKPIIGSSSINGLWIATGHYRNGVLLAAITADLIKKCLCNEKLNDEDKELLNNFNYNRFNLPKDNI